MSAAGPEQKLQQAEVAVVKAQVAYSKAHDGSKMLCGQEIEGTRAADGREANTETYNDR